MMAGRPKMSSEDRRVQCPVRMKPALWAQVQECAAGDGVSASAWVAEAVRVRLEPAAGMCGAGASALCASGGER